MASPGEPPARDAGRRRARRAERGQRARRGQRAERGQPARPKRRWLKWTGIGTAVVVVIALGLAGGVWYYVNEQVGHVRHFHGGVRGLRIDPPPDAPLDVLLIGSDSRAFAAGHPSEESHFGNAAVQTGQRSDVIIVARLIPKTHHVVMLSIPRDSWVPIYGTGGDQRINTAFDDGPTRLVETITHDFGIPIDHVVQANFPGFANIVDALGGVYLDFPDPVLDVETGLNIRQPGCQLLKGNQALALVRSRHLQYRTSVASKVWNYDGMSDWSRIRRQQAFFHAVVDRAHQSITNPFAMLRFIHAVTSDLVVDKALTTNLMESLGWSYRHAGTGNLSTMVLPTYGTYVNGSAVVVPAEPYASLVVHDFLRAGMTPAGGSSAKGHVHRSTSPGTAHPRTTTLTKGVGSTAPANQIVFDTTKTLPEPWNPVPCSAR